MLLLFAVVSAALGAVNWGPAVLGNVQTSNRRALSSPVNSQFLGTAREHRWGGIQKEERGDLPVLINKILKNYGLSFPYSYRHERKQEVNEEFEGYL